MRYFDLHCDTLTELYSGLLKFDNEKTQVNKAEVFSFEPYRQVFAVCSNCEGEAAWERFLEIAANINTFEIPKNGCILSAEGGELLCGKLERLDVLYSLSLRLLTLVWKGKTCIGGAYDTDTGLDRFGFSVLRHCFRLGIIPDLSHSSEKTFYDSLPYVEAAAKPIICSHSNSRKVFDHPRNITDEQFSIIRDMKGIVGVSFYPHHLCDGKAGIDDVLRHIEHYILLDGENTVCIGADFDGIEITPEGLSSARFISDLAFEMERRGYGKELIDKILYDNAAKFFEKNLKPAKSWEFTAVK